MGILLYVCLASLACFFFFLIKNSWEIYFILFFEYDHDAYCSNNYAQVYRNKSRSLGFHRCLRQAMIFFFFSSTVSLSTQSEMKNRSHVKYSGRKRESLVCVISSSVVSASVLRNVRLIWSIRRDGDGFRASRWVTGVWAAWHDETWRRARS